MQVLARRKSTEIDCQVIPTPSTFHVTTALPQGESEETVACCDCDILLASHCIRHRTGSHYAADGRFPQQSPIAGIQGKEVPITSPTEQQIRSGRQDASIRDISHFELPLRFAGFRVNRPGRAIALVVLPEMLRQEPVVGDKRHLYYPGVFSCLSGKLEENR